MKNNLFPVLIDSTFVGRQNCLLGIAEAISSNQYLVLPDSLIRHHCCNDFALAAHETTTSHSNFQHVYAQAKTVMRESFDRIPRDVQPVFLSYGSNYSLILAGLLLKAERPETILVSVNQPANFASFFDLIVTTPAEPVTHKQEKTFNIDAIPNRITDESLARERQKWAATLMKSIKPLVALIVGGSVPIQTGQHAAHTEKASFTCEHAKDLTERARALTQQVNADLVVTNSFRTPDNVTQILLDNLGRSAVHFYDYRKGGENPYFGYLACARTGIATAESMSMISDIVDAGIETLIYLPEGLLQARHDKFLMHMLEQKRAKPFDEGITFQPSRPIRAANEIATEIYRIAG